MAEFESGLYQRALDELDERYQRAETNPTERQKLGGYTIVCLVLNRIGSAIFVAPGIVIRGTGSVGSALALWAIGGLVAACAILVWLELALSTPRIPLRGRQGLWSVPRSGGEKNYIEYIYKTPAFLATCTFGIPFLILGSRAANAYAFGIYVFKAAGYTDYDPPKSYVIGVALGALTIVVAIHMFTRKGGIYLNNIFATIKTLFLIVIIILGILRAKGVDISDQPFQSPHNFDNAFSGTGGNVSSFANAFLFVIYAYGGFDQPFYVLAETKSPRKRMPRYTLLSVIITTTLYVGVITSYCLVVPADDQVYSKEPVFSLFIERIFTSKTAKTFMSSMVCVSIFGNLIVTTFTSSRVKQEIAKEGILPFSLFWATGRTTPFAHIWTWIRRNVFHKAPAHAQEDDLDHQEQTPLAALLLHWFSSVFLIAITSALAPQTAYTILASIYSYVLMILVGLATAAGLIYLKLTPSQNWREASVFGRVPLLLGLVPAAVYSGVCAFLAVALFIPPTPRPSYPYYIVPVIGLTAPLWGVGWWLGLQLYMRYTHFTLVVNRSPFVVPDPSDPGRFVQKAEIVDHQWTSSWEWDEKFLPRESVI